MSEPADPGAELVDVVDEDDRVVATVDRRRMRAARMRHRATFVVVNRSDGRLLVHRRSDAKDLWPGRWDLAVGGVLATGEAWDDAARRELHEELGVTGEIEPLGSSTYTDDDVDLVARTYRVVHDGPFRFTDGEVVEVRWVDRAELARLRDEATFVPDSVALLPIEILFPFPPPRNTQEG